LIQYAFSSLSSFHPFQGQVNFSRWCLLRFLHEAVQQNHPVGIHIKNHAGDASGDRTPNFLQPVTKRIDQRLAKGPRKFNVLDVGAHALSISDGEPFEPLPNRLPSHRSLVEEGLYPLELRRHGSGVPKLIRVVDEKETPRGSVTRIALRPHRRSPDRLVDAANVPYRCSARLRRTRTTIAELNSSASATHEAVSTALHRAILIPPA
jgi:hypothetical protein